MEEIASLASERRFETLTAAEQKLVLQQMSAAEFDQLHAVLQSARHIDAGVAPPADLGARLQARMAAKTVAVKKASFFRRVVSLRIPVWQVAAALLLLFFVQSFFKTNENGQVAPFPVVQTLIQTDTVFLEKVRWKERVVWLERAPEKENPGITPLASAQLEPLVSPANVLPEKLPAISLDMPATGAPIGEQPELLQFFTQPDTK